jgi:hypothetical protein
MLGPAAYYRLASFVQFSPGEFQSLMSSWNICKDLHLKTLASELQCYVF